MIVEQIKRLLFCHRLGVLFDIDVLTMVVMDGVVVVVVMNMRRLLLQNFLLLLNMMLKVLNKVARHLDDMWFSGIPLTSIGF